MYYSSQIKHTHHNSSLLWKTVNDILNNRETKLQDISVIKNEIGELREDPSEISTAFNDYFSNLGKNMASKIPGLSSSSKFSQTSLIKPRSKSFF